MMWRKIFIVYQLWRHFGTRWIGYRLGYDIRLRAGFIRRKIPVVPWEGLPLKGFLKEPSLSEPESYLDHRRRHGPRFFFHPSQRQDYLPYFSRWDREERHPVRWAEEISRGTFTYFDRLKAELGQHPDWHRNPFTGQETPPARHWSEIDDFGSGDIKVIWELNRFTIVYPLVRAYWRTGDERYPELFWRLAEDWWRHNPPQLGANWKCSQEISFRVMA